MLLGRPRRCGECGVDSVRFRRGGEIDTGLREGQFAFRRAQIVVGVLGRVGDHKRLRIGKADILDRHAHQPPAEIERILAGVEHPRQIIERSVGIGSPHRLVQGRYQIVVAVLALVVDRRPALDNALQPVRIEHLAFARRAPDFLGKGQRGAAVAIGHADERDPRLLVERQRSALGFLGAGEQSGDAVGLEPMEHQDAGARQERGVELEGRVLGRRTDEHDRTVLHHRQEGILLGAIEAVDLVDEEQRLPAVAASHARRLEHLLQVRDTGKDRRYLLEGEIGLAGQKPRDRSLAGARRSPEDHRAERARPDHARQDAVRAGDVVLADHLRQNAGPKPVGQRPSLRPLGRGVGCEQVRHRESAIRQ